MWAQCLSKLFSPTLGFFSALSKSIPPSLLEYLASGKSAYTYTFTPNNLLFWAPTAALQDFRLRGCSSSQLDLNALHSQLRITSDSCWKCTAVNHIPLNNEISVSGEIECRYGNHNFRMFLIFPPLLWPSVLWLSIIEMVSMPYNEDLSVCVCVLVPMRWVVGMDWTQRRAQSLSRASGESGRGRGFTGGYEKVSVSDFKQYSAKQTRSYTIHSTYHVPGI